MGMALVYSTCVDKMPHLNDSNQVGRSGWQETEE
jgi:hypothetical protein